MQRNLKNAVMKIAVFIMLTSSLFCQSKVEYGIGIGINHSALDEDLRNSLGPLESEFKGLRLLSLNTRIGYKASDVIHINTGVGMSWMGSLNKNLSSRIVTPTIEIPVLLEWNISSNFQWSNGFVFNHIMGITLESDLMDNDLLPEVKHRQQAGLRTGVAFSHDLVELFLNYSYYLTDVFNFTVTDANGNFLASSVSKFRNIQVGVVVRR